MGEWRSSRMIAWYRGRLREANPRRKIGLQRRGNAPLRLPSPARRAELGPTINRQGQRSGQLRSSGDQPIGPLARLFTGLEGNLS